MIALHDTRSPTRGRRFVSRGGGAWRHPSRSQAYPPDPFLTYFCIPTPLPDPLGKWTSPSLLSEFATWEDSLCTHRFGMHSTARGGGRLLATSAWGGWTVPLVRVIIPAWTINQTGQVLQRTSVVSRGNRRAKNRRTSASAKAQSYSTNRNAPQRLGAKISCEQAQCISSYKIFLLDTRYQKIINLVVRSSEF